MCKKSVPKDPCTAAVAAVLIWKTEEQERGDEDENRTRDRQKKEIREKVVSAVCDNSSSGCLRAGM